MTWNRALCALLFLIMSLPAAAEPAPSTQPDSVRALGDVGLDAAVDSIATVRFAGRALFEVSAQGVTGARERARRVEQALTDVARSYRYEPADLHTVVDPRFDAIGIMAGNQFVAAVWGFEAEARGTTKEALADERLEIMRKAIADYRSSYSTSSIIRGLILAVAAIVVFLLLLALLAFGHHRLDRLAEARLGGRTFLKVLSGESVVAVVRGLTRLLRLVIGIWLTLALLNVLLSLFPWTYGIAARVFELAAGPFRAFGRVLVAEIPSMFFLAFIVVATVMLLRGVGFVFREIERGRIRFRGFHADWARPTYNIIRVLVIAFSIAIAFPYIPGSESEAFKGMSIFIGVLVSLGSGGAMTNVISGIVLIYMRPFEVGDRVSIGGTVGDVVDRNLLTTRIRTLKNERVTIPNTSVLSEQIHNYTSKSRRTPLILHTTVTIGYDVPWRQVHELLVKAAQNTTSILEDPEPYVLQKALHDFYVEYEINAFTDEPRQFPLTYSELHQNIQDAFDEAGVEILSPHYRFLRGDRAD